MLQKLFSSSRERGSIGDRFRAKRFEHFESRLKELNKPIKILDIGGTEYYWKNRGFNNHKGIEITLLNLSIEEIRGKNMQAVVGDATNLDQYQDDAFDIVFSNSVIEHLYTLDNQTKMAKECIRVGKFYYIQTPNKYFPIEPHFRLPFFNFLPKSVQKFVLTKTYLSLGKRWDKQHATDRVDEVRLLNQSELQNLFPESKTYVEWFLFFKKSFTVHNFGR